MKPIVPILAGMLVTSASFAQGTVYLDNNVPGTVRAPVYFSGSWPLVGGEYCAQLWGTPGTNQPESALLPSVGITTFQTGTNAGFVVPIVATFTNIPADAPAATMQMRVWATWPNLGSARGSSQPFNVFNLGGNTQPAAYLANLQSFTVLRTGNLAARPPLYSWGCMTDMTPAGLTNAIAVAAGSAHGVALSSDGTVVAWGTSAPQTNVPAGLSNVIAIAASWDHSLALRTDGTVVGWGNATSPPADLTDVVAIASGQVGSLALKPDGTLVAWGGAPLPPEGLSNVVAMACGTSVYIALKDDGNVTAWGPGETNLPPDWTNIVAVAAGRHGTAVLKNDTTVARWGDDDSYTVPAGLSNVIAITAGVDGTLAIQDNGTLVGWGYNFCGESGVPMWLSNVVAMAQGYNFALAVVGDSPLVLQGPLLNPTKDPSGFHVSLETRSGRVYRLEYKEVLEESHWTALPLVAGTGRIARLRDNSPGANQRFYRVRQW